MAALDGRFDFHLHRHDTPRGVTEDGKHVGTRNYPRVWRVECVQRFGARETMSAEGGELARVLEVAVAMAEAAWREHGSRRAG